MKNVAKILHFEVQRGNRRFCHIYLFAFLVIAILTWNSLETLYVHGTFLLQDYNVSLLESIFCIFKGIKEYMPDTTTSLELPLIFMFIYFLLAYMIGDYAVKDMTHYGLQIIVRIQSKTNWWIVKVLWTTINVFIYHFFVYLGIGAAYIAFSLFHNNEICIVPYSYDAVKMVLKGIPDYTEAFIFEMSAAACVLPFLMSLAISIVQMLFTLFMKPIYSFIIVVSMYALSFYYCNIYGLANYMMLYRNHLMNENGTNVVYGIVIAAVLYIFAAWVGSVYINKKDLR